MVMPGVDPQKMAAVQAVSQHIKGEIRIDYGASTVTILLSSDNAEAKLLIPNLLEQFSDALALQLGSFFAIKGEIIEVGKPK